MKKCPGRKGKRSGRHISAAGLRLFCSLVLAALPLPQSADAARRDSSAVTRIMVLGDSLTAGFGVTRSEAYPALLTEKLRATGGSFEVINAGVSGETTSGAVRRLPDVLKHRIDLLIVELGINDAFRRVPISQMRANLQTIIDRTRAKYPNVQIIIAGMQLPLYSSDEYVRSFGTMFGEIAEKNRTMLIPYLLQGVGGDPELNLSDRIHPNAAGQKILAETVWRVLEPIARDLVAR